MNRAQKTSTVPDRIQANLELLEKRVLMSAGNADVGNRGAWTKVQAQSAQNKLLASSTGKLTTQCRWDWRKWALTPQSSRTVTPAALAQASWITASPAASTAKPVTTTKTTPTPTTTTGTSKTATTTTTKTTTTTTGGKTAAAPAAAISGSNPAPGSPSTTQFPRRRRPRWVQSKRNSPHASQRPVQLRSTLGITRPRRSSLRHTPLRRRHHHQRQWQRRQQVR